jgi:hypothetical protein
MLSAVERLDADLLELTEIDRDTGTLGQSGSSITGH